MQAYDLHVLHGMPLQGLEVALYCLSAKSSVQTAVLAMICCRWTSKA